MTTMYQLIQEQFSDEGQANEFCIWAFGEGYGIKPISRLADIWNDRHSDKLKIAGTETVPEATLMMVAVYKDGHDSRDNK